MQPTCFVTARRWLRGANADRAFATEIARGYSARAAFYSQQSAEMALKLILVAAVGDHPSTRASRQLVLDVRATPMRSATRDALG
jgi:HEPN domain-containing protein